MSSLGCFEAEFRQAVAQQEFARADSLLGQYMSALGSSPQQQKLESALGTVLWALTAARCAQAHLKQELRRVETPRGYSRKPVQASRLDLVG
jgi:hypothetical protein